MHRLVSLCLAGLLTVALSGCGQAPSSKATGTTTGQPPALSSNQELKERLDFIAKSGSTGSALAGMEEGIKKTGNKDLEKDYAELEKARSPEAIKTIAKRMASKL